MKAFLGERCLSSSTSEGRPCHGITNYKYLKYSFLLDCAEPCLQTYTKAVFIEETKILKVPGYSKIDIVFSPVVKMFLNDFQPFSFASFLASVGGALGLWLGLGVQQIIDSLFRFMQSIKIVQ